MATLNKYHGNRTNTIHFLKIVYKKLGCLSPYQKLEESTCMIGLQMKKG
jgi:hypothetical protein